MAGVERTLLVGADRRVRPGVTFTLRPIRSRNQTPQKPLWRGAAVCSCRFAVSNPGCPAFLGSFLPVGADRPFFVGSGLQKRYGASSIFSIRTAFMPFLSSTTPFTLTDFSMNGINSAFACL